MPEPYVTKITRQVRAELGLADNVPTPYYTGDRGWTLDRERRCNEIGEEVDRVRSEKCEANPELLAKLRSLLEEIEEAIRSNLETRAGMTWLEQSKLYQGLCYDWFLLTRDKMAPIAPAAQ